MNEDGGPSLLVQPTLPDVAVAVQSLAGLLPQTLATTDRHLLEVALSEVLTNIVLHGYAGAAGAPIEVCCCEGAAVLVVEVRDGGRPIPPDRLDAAGPAAFAFDPDDLAGLPQGGLGLAIVKAAFDVVDYRSEGGMNCLHLEKRLA